MSQRRAITYRRVSTGRQAESGLSLDKQRKDCAAHVDHKKWSLVAEFADEGSSGRKASNRDGLQAALAMLEAGEADVLVVAKLDRLARSTVDFGRIMQTANAQGWAIVLLDMDLDTASDNGKLVARIFAAVAEWESDRISTRVTETHAERKARGIRHGKPELPEPVRQRIADDRANGLTMQAIADRLNADQVPTARNGKWHPSTVAHVLKSVALDDAA